MLITLESMIDQNNLIRILFGITTKRYIIQILQYQKLCLISIFKIILSEEIAIIVFGLYDNSLRADMLFARHILQIYK